MHPNRQGFTLIELLIILSLIAVISSTAVPAFTELVARNRQQALRNEVQNALQNARATAVLRGETIEICGTSDARTCSGSWIDGWLIHVPATQEVLRITQLPMANPLRWNGFGQRIRFDRNGTTPTSNGRFYQCHEQRLAWQLILNRQGRLRLGTPAENADKTELCSS